MGIRAISQTKVVAHPHAMMTTAARACAAISWYPPVEKDVGTGGDFFDIQVQK